MDIFLEIILDEVRMWLLPTCVQTLSIKEESV